MATAWGEIFQHLMGAGLLASRGVKERLEQHDDPLGVIAKLRSQGVKGQLTVDMIPTSNPGRICLLYTSPSPRDLSTSRMPSSA